MRKRRDNRRRFSGRLARLDPLVRAYAVALALQPLLVVTYLSLQATYFVLTVAISTAVMTSVIAEHVRRVTVPAALLYKLAYGGVAIALFVVVALQSWFVFNVVPRHQSALAFAVLVASAVVGGLAAEGLRHEYRPKP